MAKLTSKGATPGMIYGGIAEIDRMDVAAACSRLSDLEYYLIRLKYCNDVNSVAPAVTLLEEYMGAESGKLGGLDQPVRAAMASLMLQEFVSQNHCRRCGGTGNVNKRAESIKPCPACEGSGKKAPSALGRAKACRIPESTWRHNRIGEEFDHVMGKIEVAEASALAYVSLKVS